MKKRLLLLFGFLSLHTITYTNLEELPNIGAELADGGIVSYFSNISFHTLSRTSTVCYAVAHINNKNCAIKINIQKPTNWRYEEKFKGKEVDFFGVLGTDRICVLNNGDLYAIQKTNNKIKWSVQPILKLRKYTDEIITSCTGLSLNNFWITLYNNKTQLNSILLASHNEKVYNLAPTDIIGVSITPNKQHAWFIKKKADKKYTVEISELNEDPLEQSSSITSKIPLELSSLNNLTALDDTEAFFLDKNRKNIYRIIPEGDVTILTGSTQPIGALGILNNTLIAAIGNKLYKYVSPPAPVKKEPFSAPQPSKAIAESPIITVKQKPQLTIPKGASKTSQQAPASVQKQSVADSAEDRKPIEEPTLPKSDDKYAPIISSAQKPIQAFFKKKPESEIPEPSFMQQAQEPIKSQPALSWTDMIKKSIAAGLTQTRTLLQTYTSNELKESYQRFRNWFSSTPIQLIQPTNIKSQKPATLPLTPIKTTRTPASRS